ncbi:MAG: exodeoxyribonuclease V subunit gamma, partial [Proteobacteria bacterium]|nr:exodeoxyribonuclease V subunit gamma [Pseudomonadota bacterium]
DGADRALRGLPDSEENTWRAGIERLLLGFAMPGRESMMFQDILPYDRMEGSESQVLGNFVAFLEELFSQVSMLTDSRTLKGWAEALSTMLDRLFLLSEDTEQDTQIVRSAVNRLSLIEDQSGFTGQIELAVVRSWLESVFREESGGRGFLTGRVTFCAMLPMRSIPFKVMCLIGMNDGAFPRAATAVGFDLISRHPRRGDRSQRIDDRYLFLESIISAREKLYISYTGQGIQDNSEIPPSVLVSELLDYVEQGFEIPEKQIRDYLVVRHRLQAFSPRYFQKGNTLFSYSDENCFASKALSGTRKEPVPFITNRLFEPEQAEKTVSLQDIMRFFDNPVRFLLTRRLCLTLYEAETVIVEREAFELAGLERYAIERRLCEWYLSGQDAAPLYRIIRAAGMLPHGEVGSAAFRKTIPGTARFVQRLRPYLQGEKRASCAVDIVCAGYRLVGQISDIWQGRLVRFRYGKIRARDRLRAWLLHLVRAVSGDSSCRPRGLLIGKDTSFELQLLEDGRELLEQLVSLYDRGLTELTPFFPETSLAYVQALRSKKSHDEALKAAQRAWAGSDYRHGECEDPYYEFCFGRFDPFDQRFVELACSVYEPLLTHQKEVNP